jgi:ABC-type multidrug transport system fused ATPase/permease subunit
MKSLAHYIKRLHAAAGFSLYVNIAGMAASSLLESISVLLLVPLLGLIGILSIDAGSGAFAYFSELLGGLPQLTALIAVLAAYALLVLGQNLISRSVMIRNVDIQQHFASRLRLDAYGGILRASWPFFLRKRASDLINLMTIELARVLGAINLFLQLLSSLIFTIIQIAIALWIAPGLTLFVLGCGLVLGLCSGRFIRRAKALGNQTSQLSQSYLAGLTDQISGMKDIKSNTLEASRLQWLGQLTGGMHQEQLSYIRLRMNSQLVYKVSSAVLIACFILISFRMFQTQGAQLLAITVIFARLWPRFTSIQSNLEQLASMIPACRALLALQQECEQAAERLDAEQATMEPLKTRRCIECRNLSFRYDPNQEAFALRHIYAYIPANKMTAIAGPSGAGKSTLIDLIMGLMEPGEGQILVDGTPITNDNLLAYRRSISYVAQEPFLFHASIRDNLLMIMPAATDEQMWEALEFAACAEFVRRLPQGLDTVIGDRGIRLSGGERQRLVLARAVIRKPAILVLDEATSALDTDNERIIQEAIERLKGSMTVIVVAHRLSTIRHADQVLVIDQGRLVEQGEYGKLAADRTSMLGHLLHRQTEEASA